MKLIKIFLLSILVTLGVSVNSFAGTVSAESVMQERKLAYDKQVLINIVSTEEMTNKLVELGVSRSDAIARIDSMTSAEIASFNDHLENSEAGGIVGTVVTVLVVVLVTDLLGITDAYPFIRPIGG